MPRKQELELTEGVLGALPNDAATIAELARQAVTHAHTVVTGEGREFLVVPDGFDQIEVSDPHGPAAKKPPYVRQAVTLQTVDSLVDYVNRFKNADTVLFADMAASTIRAAIDYHGAADGDGAIRPERGAHQAAMVLPFSEEWRIWSGASGKLMPQLEFARFVEENGADVTAPVAGELLDAVRDLQAKRKVNFIKAVRTASDNENFEYTDETTATTRGGVEVPTKFVLALPVYFGEAPVELHAFLRWRLDDGQLLLGVKLHRAEHVRQAVFRAIVHRVGEGTGCPVMFGTAG